MVCCLAKTRYLPASSCSWAPISNTPREQFIETNLSDHIRPRNARDSIKRGARLLWRVRRAAQDCRTAIWGVLSFVSTFEQRATVVQRFAAPDWVCRIRFKRERRDTGTQASRFFPRRYRIGYQTNRMPMSKVGRYVITVGPIVPEDQSHVPSMQRLDRDAVLMLVR